MLLDGVDDAVPLHTSESGAACVMVAVVLGERRFERVPLIVDTGSTAVVLPPSVASNNTTRVVDFLEYSSVSLSGSWQRGDVVIGNWGLAQVLVFLADQAPLDFAGILGLSPRSELLRTFGRVTLSLQVPARLSMAPVQQALPVRSGTVVRTGVATWLVAVSFIEVAGRVIARNILAVIDSGSSHIICPRRIFQLIMAVSLANTKLRLVFSEGLCVHLEARLCHSDQGGCWVLGLPFLSALQSVSFDARRGNLTLEELRE
jgi:hypothetical protein